MFLVIKIPVSLLPLTLYLIETPFNIFTNRVDPDLTAFIRATRSGYTLFACENMIRYDPTLVDLASNFFVLCTKLKVYLYNRLFSHC